MCSAIDTAANVPMGGVERQEEAPGRRREAAGGLQDEIYTAVRGMIVRGAKPPGERLLELRLADDFGTSQAPVREALRRLAQEGLVVSVPRRGTFVAKPSLAEIEVVYQLRADVESLAIRRFVPRVGDAEIGELYRCLEDMRLAVEEQDHAAGTEADMRFHKAICDGSGSQLLSTTWASIDNRVRGLQAVVAARSYLATQLVETHEPILRALVRRDAGLAEALMRAHLEEAWSELKDLFAEYDESRPDADDDAG